MRILICSDGHGNVENLKRLKDEAEKSDFVIFAGDFTAFGKPETAMPFFNEVVALHSKVFSVLGNCDTLDLLKEMQKAGISINAEIAMFENLFLAGSGGGSKFTGTTPYERTDDELAGDLDVAKAEMEQGRFSGKNLIVVTHNPAKNTKLDRAGIIHVGSPKIRSFIDKYKPVLAVSGHIHESFAVEKIGETVFVNPGALLDGRYAVCEISEKADCNYVVEDCSLKRLELGDIF
ncbi:MAG: serine/threonine protein phosphatase [Treponema sp.]|nr:MAG: serine/threonine protein phosphatase [Treponema sp.]